MMTQETAKQQRPIDETLANVNNELTNKVSAFLKQGGAKSDTFKDSISKTMQEILKITKRNTVIKTVPTVSASKDEFHFLGIDSTKNTIVFATLLSYEGKNRGLLVRLELNAQIESIAQKTVADSIEIFNSRNKVKEAAKSWDVDRWRTVKSEASALTELIR
ncbi:MAG: hypothetical protein KGH54_04005 [Candidatus Micrarchaeota archaeon]|nr:hypothetical protein [Candidatus Micrarchaeota archaeon]